jgi:hypothetical protein
MLASETSHADARRASLSTAIVQGIDWGHASLSQRKLHPPASSLKSVGKGAPWYQDGSGS